MMLPRSLLVLRTVSSCRGVVECFYSTVSTVERGNLTELNNTHQEISEGRLLRDESYIKVVTGQILSTLGRGMLNSKQDLQATAMVMRAIAKNSPPNSFGLQEMFDQIAEMLLRTHDESILQVLLPSFLMACKSLRYYNPSLMSHAGKFVIDNLKNFDQNEVDTIVHAYAKLNHHVPNFIPEIERWILMKHPNNVSSHLLWSLVWCGMVFSEYPKEVLSRILTDDYIEGCGGTMFDDFFTILFQLKISLNKECPELKLGLGYDNEEDLKQWSMCRSGLKGISSRMLRRCYMIKLQQYYTRGRSTFGMKVHTAVNSTLGGNMYAQFDGLSLSGYLFDFEVLLDRDNAPIPIPRLWKHRNSQTLAASIGEQTPMWNKAKKKAPQSLIDSMRQTEVEPDGRVGDDSEGNHFPTPEHGHNIGLTSLASDWGTKFAKVSGSVARKLVIEANGLRHYAQNCDHPLGSTVVKTKQLQHLGWEVLSVNYREWMHLDSQEAKAKFIDSMIYRGRC